MQSQLRFQTATLTEPGGREVNEDALGFFERDDLHVWILCDGLGGHGSGDVASRLVVDKILASAREIDPELPLLLNEANQVIVEAQTQDPLLAKMHSTAVVLRVKGSEALWAHIGDSRLYHFRAAKVAAQTLDHSLVQANVNAGNLEAVEIRFHPDRSRLLRSLGTAGEVKATVLSTPVNLEASDALLLCSDGFWELVLESEMEASLAETPTAEAWLGRMHEILKLRAQNVDETDNYSAIAIRVESAHDQ